jgi:hypothetical protein
VTVWRGHASEHASGRGGCARRRGAVDSGSALDGRGTAPRQHDPPPQILSRKGQNQKSGGAGRTVWPSVECRIGRPATHARRPHHGPHAGRTMGRTQRGATARTALRVASVPSCTSAFALRLPFRGRSRSPLSRVCRGDDNTYFIYCCIIVNTAPCRSLQRFIVH